MSNGVISCVRYALQCWVRLQDYFRDITKEDLQQLLSFVGPPNEDEHFLVPVLGQHYSSRSTAAPLPVVSTPAVAPPRLEPEGDGQEVGAQHAPFPSATGCEAIPRCTRPTCKCQGSG